MGGRPNRHSSRQRGETFKGLIGQGLRPDVAARTALIDPWRALRLLGEGIGLVATQMPEVPSG